MPDLDRSPVAPFRGTGPLPVTRPEGIMKNSTTSRRVGTVAAAAVIGLAGLASLPAVADAAPGPAQAQA